MPYDLHSKILLSSLVSAASGRQSEIKIRGSKPEVDTLMEVIEATKSFKEVLNRPGVTFSEISEALARRQKAATDFHELTGLAWPL